MPVTPSARSERFQERLTYISRVYALVGPLGVMALVATLQYAFTDYFDNQYKGFILPALIIVNGMVAARIFFRKATKARLAFEYSVITFVAVAAYTFLLPYPSPYILAGALFAVLIYFEFGAEWSALSLTLEYGALIIAAVNHQPELKVFLTALGYTLGPTTMAIFIMRLEGLARQEIRSIENHSQKAMENDQQIQSLINNISDGVVAVDHNLRVIMYNAAAMDVLDVNVNIRGKHIRKFLKPVNAENQAVDIDELLHNTSTQINNRDLSINYNDGSRANLYLGIAPIYLGYGKSGNNGYTIVLRDITREKSLEEERDEFISVVSHELRTPIAITEGNISNAEFVAEKTKDIGAIQDALKESHKQVLFLAAMINDLSTLSRAERGVLEVEVEPIAIQELATELSASYTPQAEAKDLAFKLDIDPNATELRSSRLYTKEILQNFITNAIKYTDKGTVTLHAYADPKGIRFAVQDTGIGISKGDQQKVFDKFFRSEDYRTRKASGTGLGLYVTMKLTRLIHAEIEVESELNKGSTFTIFVPNLD